MKKIAVIITLLATLNLYGQQVEITKLPPPAGIQLPSASDPINVTTNGDPCGNTANTKVPFNVSFASTTAQLLVPATSAKKGYICEFTFDTQNASGDKFSVLDGTQSTNPCDSGTPTALYGNTTVGSGIFVNPGVVRGADGRGTIMQTSNTNRQICIVVASATQATASGVYVVQ